MDTVSAGERVGVAFAHALGGFGDRVALIAGRERLTYRELADRVEATARMLGATRRLVLLAAANDVESLVAYLAALRGGHPVLLCSPDGETRDALVAAYDPDVVVDGGIVERRTGTAHELHPDLAVLLSTSGSTGSPKLVRLSADNVESNAEAIGDYLDIRDTDRAATTLPPHYCYGLSVVNSNLARGAALLLGDHSVVDQRFWDEFAEHGGTSLHGVPYTFELLDRAGFADRVPPTLRYVTQAGGRLAPDTVRRYAELAERDGWRLFVMYGQTEATARMAYLPPELAATRPTAVGVPIPGGAFEIRQDGELVYRGPNVMMGYARRPEDLALGATLDALPTGDLARRADDGLYEVIGRKSRFVKLFGLRVDLDEVERLLADAGWPAIAAGDDTAVTVALLGRPGARSAARAARLVAQRVGLPADRVRVKTYDEPPRLPSGKIDYAAIAEPEPVADQPVDSVRQVFQRALNLDDVPDDATFVSLGGDSLTYVRASIDLERVLGHVPDGWHTTPVAELDRRREPAGVLRSLETNILVRAAAIVLIVCTHIGVARLWGGAHVLLVVAGWSFARFALAPVDPDRMASRIARAAARVAVPSALFLAWRAAETDNVSLFNVLLVNNFVQAGAISYWYVEALVQILAVLALVFSIPRARAAALSHGYALAMGALGIALVARLWAAHVPQPNGYSARDMSLHGVFWLFVIGWAAQRSTTLPRKAATAAVALLLIPGYFDDPVRDGIVVGGLLLIMFVPRVVVPGVVARLCGLLAGASLYIYLTHYIVYWPLLGQYPAWLVVGITLAVGVAVWRAVCLLGRARRRALTLLGV